MCISDRSSPSVINVYRSVVSSGKLFPDEFWRASKILSPSKIDYVSGVRPKRWGILVTELVYAPLGIDAVLSAVVGTGSERWHRHLDEHGRSLVYEQCMAVTAAVDAGTTLRRLRSHFARQSVPGEITLPLDCPAFVPKHRFVVI